MGVRRRPHAICMWCAGPNSSKTGRLLKIDAGEPVLHRDDARRKHGSPAMTVDLGSARQWTAPFIDRAVAFLGRLVADLGHSDDDDGRR